MNATTFQQLLPYIMTGIAVLGLIAAGTIFVVRTAKETREENESDAERQADAILRFHPFTVISITKDKMEFIHPIWTVHSPKKLRTLWARVVVTAGEKEVIIEHITEAGRGGIEYAAQIVAALQKRGVKASDKHVLLPPEEHEPGPALASAN